MPRGRQTAKREAAILALLTEVDIGTAAAKVGISHNTLKNWLRDETFRRDYVAHRRAVVEDTVRLLARGANKAALALERNVTCGKPGVEVRAASVLLDRCLEGLRTFDLAEEVAALRRELEEIRRGSSIPHPAGTDGQRSAGNGRSAQAGEPP
jgi:hypothetical protein